MILLRTTPHSTTHYLLLFCFNCILKFPTNSFFLLTNACLPGAILHRISVDLITQKSPSCVWVASHNVRSRNRSDLFLHPWFPYKAPSDTRYTNNCIYLSIDKAVAVPTSDIETNAVLCGALIIAATTLVDTSVWHRHVAYRQLRPEVGHVVSKRRQLAVDARPRNIRRRTTAQSTIDDLLSCGFTSHSTLNRSFWGRSPS